MWEYLSRILWLRSLWVAVVGALVHYHYSSVNPELTLVLWDGYLYLAAWVLLLLILLEFTFVLFTKVFRNRYDELDVVLAGLGIMVVMGLSASYALDSISVNRLSKVYTTANVLDDYQCNSIIQIAENHAIVSLMDSLSELDKYKTSKDVGLQEAAEIARLKVLQSGGWLTDRHANYPTTDFSVRSIHQNISLRENDQYGQVSYQSVDFQRWVEGIVQNKIFPILLDQYDLIQPTDQPPLLSVKDLFIVKYSAETENSQRDLELHVDSSQLSFNIALSTYINPNNQETNTASTDSIDKAKEEIATNGDSSWIGACSSEYSNIQNISGSHCAAQRNDTYYSGGGTYFLRANRVLHTKKGSMISHPSRLYHSGSTISAGTRYLLVGFISVRQYSWNTVYRRFGMFSRCMSHHQYDPTQSMRSVHTQIGVESKNEWSSTVNSDGPEFYCQWYLWVAAFDLFMILRQPFIKFGSSRNSRILAIVLSITVVAFVAAIISLFALCTISETNRTFLKVPPHVEDDVFLDKKKIGTSAAESPSRM